MAEESQSGTDPTNNDGINPDDISMNEMQNAVPAQSIFFDTQPCSIVSGTTRGTSN
jgi:hypothetical protein